MGVSKNNKSTNKSGINFTALMGVVSRFVINPKHKVKGSELKAIIPPEMIASLSPYIAGLYLDYERMQEARKSHTGEDSLKIMFSVGINEKYQKIILYVQELLPRKQEQNNLYTIPVDDALLEILEKWYRDGESKGIMNTLLEYYGSDYAKETSPKEPNAISDLSANPNQGVTDSSSLPKPATAEN